jgi:hypothetical protein
VRGEQAGVDQLVVRLRDGGAAQPERARELARGRELLPGREPSCSDQVAQVALELPCDGLDAGAIGAEREVDHARGA